LSSRSELLLQILAAPLQARLQFLKAVKAIILNTTLFLTIIIFLRSRLKSSFASAGILQQHLLMQEQEDMIRQKVSDGEIQKTLMRA